jgi:hypothetical protein
MGLPILALDTALATTCPLPPAVVVDEVEPPGEAAVVVVVDAAFGVEDPQAAAMRATMTTPPRRVRDSVALRRRAGPVGEGVCSAVVMGSYLPEGELSARHRVLT